MSIPIDQAQRLHPELFEPPPRRGDPRVVADDLRDRRISGIMAAVDYLMQKSQRPSPVANTDALEAAVAELRRELAALRADIVVDALTARADRAEAELAELRRRTAQMEAQLEGKGIPRYLGIWKSGLYTEGSCVTDHGSVLVCSRQTDGRPGQDDAWTLAVKRGADGRSAVSPRPSGAAEPRP